MHPPTVPILMYHSVNTTVSGSFGAYTVTPTRLAEHLDALREAGWQSVTVTEAAQGLTQPESAPKRMVALTFDDGFADFASDALPALHARQARATLYVPTAYVGQTARWLDEADANRRMLSWAALADVRSSGVEIGSHGHTHSPLDVARHTAIVEDLTRSRGLLEDHLSVSVSSLAYPYGYQGRRARQAAAIVGFRTACAVIGLPATTRDHRFALPRLAVRQQMTGPDLVHAVERQYHAAERNWRVLKQHVWGVARRARLVGPCNTPGVRSSVGVLHGSGVFL